MIVPPSQASRRAVRGLYWSAVITKKRNTESTPKRHLTLRKATNPACLPLRGAVNSDTGVFNVAVVIVVTVAYIRSHEPSSHRSSAGQAGSAGHRAGRCAAVFHQHHR